MYQNNLANVDADILSGASNLAQLDASDNELSDGSLAFVPKGTRSLILTLGGFSMMPFDFIFFMFDCGPSLLER